MEEGIVYVESSTDLTPVLEAMEQLESIAAGQAALIGVLLGVMIVVVLAVMFQ